MRYLKNIKLFESINKEELDFNMFKDICLDLSDLLNVQTVEKDDEYIFSNKLKYKKYNFRTEENYSQLYSNNVTSEQFSKEDIVDSIDEYLNSGPVGEKELKLFRESILISNDIIDRLKEFNFKSLLYQIQVYHDALDVNLFLSIKIHK
jgi:hypothetical protein